MLSRCSAGDASPVHSAREGFLRVARTVHVTIAPSPARSQPRCNIDAFQVSETASATKLMMEKASDSHHQEVSKHAAQHSSLLATPGFLVGELPGIVECSTHVQFCAPACRHDHV